MRFLTFQDIRICNAFHEKDKMFVMLFTRTENLSIHQEKLGIRLHLSTKTNTESVNKSIGKVTSNNTL